MVNAGSPQVIEIWNTSSCNTTASPTAPLDDLPPSAWTPAWASSASAPSSRQDVQLRHRRLHAAHRGRRPAFRQALRRG
jgi:hypothetical protein